LHNVTNWLSFGQGLRLILHSPDELEPVVVGAAEVVADGIGEALLLGEADKDTVTDGVTI
jgi:hypothetical protein